MQFIAIVASSVVLDLENLNGGVKTIPVAQHHDLTGSWSLHTRSVVERRCLRYLVNRRRDVVYCHSVNGSGIIVYMNRGVARFQPLRFKFGDPRTDDIAPVVATVIELCLS